jgi:hypothetical protein
VHRPVTEPSGHATLLFLIQPEVETEPSYSATYRCNASPRFHSNAFHENGPGFTASGPLSATSLEPCARTPEFLELSRPLWQCLLCVLSPIGGWPCCAVDKRLHPFRRGTNLTLLYGTFLAMSGHSGLPDSHLGHRSRSLRGRDCVPSSSTMVIIMRALQFFGGQRTTNSIRNDKRPYDAQNKCTSARSVRRCHQC